MREPATPTKSNALDAFRAALQLRPDGAAIRYFDGSLSYRMLDRASDALAAKLVFGGVQAGDRVALYLQNTPGFVIGLLAGWKAGAVPVPINPMNRQRELSMLLADCAPRAMLCQDTLFPDVVERLPDQPPLIVTTAAREFQSRNDARLFTPGDAVGSGPDGLAAIVATGGSVPAIPTSSQDIAFIVYTSGTTGVPKGSISTHAAAMHSTTMMCECVARISC